MMLLCTFNRYGSVVAGIGVLTYALTISSFCAPRVVHAQSSSQDGLPDDAAKPTVLAKCTQCHGADMFANRHQSEAEWDATITKMQGKGLQISDADYDAVLGYFTKYLATLPERVKVNSATAEELSKALDLSEKEAASVVKARETQGKFKEWKDLTKIDGVNAKKIEAKKDSLSFE